MCVAQSCYKDECQVVLEEERKQTLPQKLANLGLFFDVAFWRSPSMVGAANYGIQERV